MMTVMSFPSTGLEGADNEQGRIKNLYRNLSFPIQKAFCNHLTVNFVLMIVTDMIIIRMLSFLSIEIDLRTPMEEEVVMEVKRWSSPHAAV